MFIAAQSLNGFLIRDDFFDLVDGLPVSFDEAYYADLVRMICGI